jgi:filamentous hemagglutinin
LIGEAGEVAIVGDQTLFLNFGSRARAEEFLARRIDQGMPGATVRSFEVPRSFVDELRAIAVPEIQARQFPGRPIIVDVTRAPDQFGLRAKQIEALRRAIIQGTGQQGF